MQEGQLRVMSLLQIGAIANISATRLKRIGAKYMHITITEHIGKILESQHFTE
jgi:hypothetical protein